MSLNQAYLFYIFLLTGILVGILFDIFRILRKSFKHSDFITLLQDIVFVIIMSVLIIYTVFKFNNGEIRSYVIIGLAAGIIIYFTIFSKIFIKVNVTIINFLKVALKFILNIFLFPFKLIFNLIKKIVFKPVAFIFINLRKTLENILKKMSKNKIKSVISYKKSKKN